MLSTIDLENDELTPVGVLVKQRLGKRPSPATVWRWTQKGVCTPGGGRVKLAAVRVGGKLYSTPEAFNEFVRAQNEAATPTDDPPVERSASTKRRLKAAGLT